MESATGKRRRRLRRLVGLLAMLAVCAFAIGTVFHMRRARSRAGPRPVPVTGAPPASHTTDPAAYRLHIYGKVRKELSLTLDQVKALPSVESDPSLSCVLGGTEDAVWRGARIRDVLALAEPLDEATFVVFRDDDDFSSSLSMDYVRSGKPVLAWEADGEPLPLEQGWPLRVVAPEKWGYKWVKWVAEIELTDRGYEGTYESWGFSLNGNLDEPRTEAEKHGQ